VQIKSHHMTAEEKVTDKELAASGFMRDGQIFHLFWQDITSASDKEFVLQTSPKVLCDAPVAHVIGKLVTSCTVEIVS